MSVKYLDYTGLVYLWSKIKSLFLLKTDISSWAKASTKPSYTLDEVSDGTTRQWANKADKSEMSVATGTGADSDKTTITLKSGISATVINSHQDISGKVNTSRTVNGHALSSDVTVTKSDVGLGSVTDDAQVKRSEMGVANGVATLDSSGLIPSSQLPGYVDDVIEAYPRSGQTALSQNWLATESASGTVITPSTGKIYVLMVDYTETVSGETVVVYAANTQFRWGGTAYVKLNDGGVVSITNAEIDAAYDAA